MMDQYVESGLSKELFGIVAVIMVAVANVRKTFPTCAETLKDAIQKTIIAV